METRSLTGSQRQDAIDDMAGIDKMLPMSEQAQHEFGRAVLMMSITTRKELIDALNELTESTIDYMIDLEDFA